MSKERYNEIIHDAYSNFLRNSVPHDRQETKDEFVKRIKSDKEFSERWGLKIVERELSVEERLDLASKTYSVFDPFDFYEVSHKEIDKLYPVPTKEITITYNNEIINYYG